MFTLCIILTALSCLTCLIWSSRHRMITREVKSGFVLTPQYAGPPADAPMISVIVAAKDEQENIEGCVRSLLDQDYPNYEIIAVNDRSDDKTGEILDRLDSEFEHLKVLHIAELPDGWTGKVHAMYQAGVQARGDYLCMIDADCTQTTRRTLSVTMQYAIDTHSDMISALPQFDLRGFWENAIQPVCSGVLMIWFHPDKVNNPRKTNAYANGAYMMLSRQAYETIGTFEAMKSIIHDDMHLASLVKGAGLKLAVMRTDGLYSLRMYTSLGQICNGWTRIFFGAFKTFRRLIVSFMVMLIMGLVPYIAAVLGLTLAVSEPGISWLICGIAGVVGSIMQQTVIFRYFHLLGGKPWLCWTYPLGSVISLSIIARAMSKHRRGAQITWRNTSYVNNASKS